MEFNYRYVGFGTKFTPASGMRATETPDSAELYDNELAVDVGGACWGRDGEPARVIDHHFFRADGNYPSASAGVLHNARRIYEHFHKIRPRVVWMVAHRQPDFDAYCAMYLARGVLTRLIPHEG